MTQYVSKCRSCGERLRSQDIKVCQLGNCHICKDCVTYQFSKVCDGMIPICGYDHDDDEWANDSSSSCGICFKYLNKDDIFDCIDCNNDICKYCIDYIDYMYLCNICVETHDFD